MGAFRELKKKQEERMAADPVEVPVASPAVFPVVQPPPGSVLGGFRKAKYTQAPVAVHTPPELVVEVVEPLAAEALPDDQEIVLAWKSLKDDAPVAVKQQRRFDLLEKYRAPFESYWQRAQAGDHPQDYLFVSYLVWLIDLAQFERVMPYLNAAIEWGLTAPNPPITTPSLRVLRDFEVYKWARDEFKAERDPSVIFVPVAEEWEQMASSELQKDVIRLRFDLLHKEVTSISQPTLERAKVALEWGQRALEHRCAVTSKVSKLEKLIERLES